MINKQNFLIICMMLLLTSACSNVKQSLGFNRTSPDEFTVMSRAPLDIPPNFDLRPPRPGAKRPQDGDVSKIAKKALLSTSSIYGKRHAYGFGTEENESSQESAGVRAFLKLVGADKASNGVRKMVDDENSALISESEDFTTKLMFWQEPSDPTEVLVDATKEARRLQENQALSKDITEGETPIIKRKKKGLLESIF